MNDYFSGSACQLKTFRDEGVVRKRVYYKNQGVENGYNKLLHEAHYINRMNQIDNRWYPRILNCFYSSDQYYTVEMEYLFDGKSLADIMFDFSFHDDYLLRSLELILRKLYAEFYVAQEATINPNYWQKCYLERTRRRMDITLNLIETKFPHWTLLKNSILYGITVNNIRYSSIYSYLSYLESHLELQSIFPLARTYRTHHDLIPENIMVLCSGETGAIKDFRLIDPRSDFETGIDCRHFIYDAGKMMFGLDCYGLFRRTHRAMIDGDYLFQKNDDGTFDLYFYEESSLIKRLMKLQKRFVELFTELAKEKEPQIDATSSLAFSYAFMYSPDVPCRVIDEQSENLALEFYSRGIQTIHYLMLTVFGEDILSSDRTGSDFMLWDLQRRDGNE